MPGGEATAQRLAKVLADTIVRHAPWSSEIAERTRRKVTDEWLDGLEAHTAGLVGPVLTQLLEATDPPPAIRDFIAEGIAPSKAFSGILTQIFAYGVANQVLTAGLTPYMTVLLQDSYSHGVAQGSGVALSPADVATALTQAVDFGDAQGVEVPQWALDEVAKSGLDAERFKTIVGVDGQAPDATSLFEMFRRGVIDEAQLRNGFLEGPTKNKWIPFLEKLQYITPTPADLVRSAVQNQITYDEAATLAHSLGLEPQGWVTPTPAQAEDLAKRLGGSPADYQAGNPDWFKLLYDTYGRPPGPQEMGRAANRGFVAWTGKGSGEISFEQAISESDIKDKYIPLLQKLAVYYPPNGEIRTMVLHGGLTDEQAIELWKANGVPEEIAKAYLYLARTEQITQDKAIAKGDILTLVKELAISDDQAMTLLGEVGYSGQNAETLVKMAHYQYELEVLRRSVTRVGTLYVGHKIDDAQARDGFAHIGLGPAQIDTLMQTLSAERAAETIPPTAGEVSSALYYQVVNQDTAQLLLEQMGYTPWDAWLRLSTRMHGPLPNEPTSGKPASQPTALQIAERQYHAAVQAADASYQSQVELARSEFLSLTPPNQESYDAAVGAAKTTLDAALHKAEATYEAAGGTVP